MQLKSKNICFRVLFPGNVKWMSLEFDPACATAQPEDSLQLYVPSTNNDYKTYSKYNSEENDSPPFPYWPILHKFTSSSVFRLTSTRFRYSFLFFIYRIKWPQNAVILPGHEVIFSLETASDYLKDDRASSFGFRCMVVGYEWPPTGGGTHYSSLKHLESELAFLGGMCTASLIKKDLQLPTAASK